MANNEMGILTDMKYIELIQLFRSEFQNFFNGMDNENNNWNNIISLANGNANDIPSKYLFNRFMHPHFYSGNLMDENGNHKLNENIKIVFLTMNPRLKAKDRNYANIDHFREIRHNQNGAMPIIPLNLFLNAQNENFLAMENDPRPSRIYVNCDKVVRQIINGNIQPINNHRYGALHEHAVTIDWLPFYSTNFKLNDNQIDFARTMLEIILGMLPNNNNNNNGIHCPIIAVGRPMQNTLREIYGEGKPIKNVNHKLLPNLIRWNIEGNIILSFPKLAGFPSNNTYRPLEQKIDEFQ